MTLNCKQGDLAMVVRGGRRPGSIPVGTIIQCRKFVPISMNVDTGELVPDVWEIDYHAPLDPKACDGWAIEDWRLRPLDNPGDEAVDSRDIKLGEAMRTQVREDGERTPALIGQGGEA